MFCVAAAHSIVSPFVLYDLACEAAHVLTRSTPLPKALLHPHVRTLSQSGK